MKHLKYMKGLSIKYKLMYMEHLKTVTNEFLGITLNVYTHNGDLWFRAFEIATILKCNNRREVIKYNIPDDRDPLKTHPDTIFIKEPGLYALIFRSKLETAKVFQDWVFSEVLPSIRKYGYYRMFNNPNTLTFKIEDEYDGHIKLVQFIRRFYPEILMTAGLGENQDTKDKRIKSFKKGFMKGQPNLTVHNLHKHYNCQCIEFKTPQCSGIITDQQKQLIERYEENEYKCIVPND